MNLLNQLTEDTELPRHILIEDDPSSNSLLFLKAIVKSYLKKNEDYCVHLICSESLTRKFTEDSKISTVADNFMIYDVSVDPQNWIKDDTSINFESIYSHIVDKSLTKSKNVYIFESISSFMNHLPILKVCQMLHNLSNCVKGSSVISFIHPSLHNIEEISVIKHTASTVLKMQANPRTFLLHFDILHQKLTGKIINLTKMLSIDCDYNTKEVYDLDLSKVNIKEESNSDKDADPTANLTFNLNLKQDEVKAREKLVLPFTKSDREISEGKIIYQPDETDDYDDEDPDDDLDI